MAAMIEKEVRVELWMPKQWNHKLVAVGNGRGHEAFIEVGEIMNSFALLLCRPVPCCS
jgi:hypothetical protein